MKIPLQIHFHDLPVSPALESLIREKAAKLEQFHPNLTGCRVVVDKPHQHSQQGDQFSVVVDVSVPGATIVANNASSEDPNVAVRDAFLAARRQVEDLVKRQRTEARQAAARTPPVQVGLDGTAVVVAASPVAGRGGLDGFDAAEAEAHELDGTDEFDGEALEAGGLDGADDAPGEAETRRTIAPMSRATATPSGAPGL
jgi:ribosome-associated translation inhibitor RaiA